MARHALSVRLAGKSSKRVLVKSQRGRLKISRALLHRLHRHRTLTLPARIAEVGGTPAGREIPARVRR